MDYKELAKKLNFAYSDAVCKECQTWGELMRDAADAIEELQREIEREEALAGCWEWMAEDCKGRFQKFVDALPKWIPAEDKLPEEPGTYLVCVHEPLEKEGCLAEYNMSYVDLLLYDAEQGIWQNGQYDAYNAHLEFVDKKHAYFISHWQEKPALPKEEG